MATEYLSIRRAHHGNLDLLIAQSGDTSGPFSFDCGPPFEFETKFAKEINRAYSRLELSRFLTPPFVADHRNAPVNALAGC